MKALRDDDEDEGGSAVIHRLRHASGRRSPAPAGSTRKASDGDRASKASALTKVDCILHVLCFPKRARALV